MSRLDDNIARLLRDNVKRQGNVKAWDLGEYAGIYHPQALDAAHPEPRVEDGVGALPSSVTVVKCNLNSS